MSKLSGNTRDPLETADGAAYRSPRPRGAANWAQALRAPFLTVSAFPVAIGTFLAGRAIGEWQWLLYGLATLATAAVHLASNVGNDLVDDASGADRDNEERISPFTGGSRVLQDGTFNRDDLGRLVRVLLVIAAAAGLVLVTMRGPVVLAWGLAGIALGAMYTSPWMRLAYRGLGEVAIAIAFGLLPVCGAYWLQAGSVTAAVALISLAPAAWTTCVLLVNEVPDRRADARAGKRTLAVRLGARGIALLQLALHTGALIAVAGAASGLSLPRWTVLALLPLPVIAVLIAKALASPAPDPASMKRAILLTLTANNWGSLVLVAAALLD